jgi:transposase
MYAYSVKKRTPAFYKLFEGSITDKTTLTDFLREAKIRNSYVLIDNGFESPSNLESLLENKNKYILALKCNSRHVTNDILEDGFRAGAKEKFTYNSEAVYGYELTGDGEDERICVYFNQAIAALEAKTYLERVRKRWKGYTDESFEKDCRYFGIYVLKTNVMNFSLKKVYEYYKARFEIEYMFDTIKNTYEIDNVYLSSDEALESWMFINHLTISITYEIYKLLRDADLLSSLSPRRLLKKLRQVIKQRNILDKNEVYEFQVIPSKTKDIIDKLKIPL